MKWNDEIKIKVWEITFMWVIIWINMILACLAIMGVWYLL